MLDMLGTDPTRSSPSQSNPRALRFCLHCTLYGQVVRC
jgi:hypothetical protein